MKSGPLPRVRARMHARVSVESVGSCDWTLALKSCSGVVCGAWLRAKPGLSVAVLSRRVVSARDRAPAHTQVMRITWKEIAGFLAVAVLVVVLCLVAVDVLSGFYTPVSAPDGY